MAANNKVQARQGLACQPLVSRVPEHKTQHMSSGKMLAGLACKVHCKHSCKLMPAQRQWSLDLHHGGSPLSLCPEYAHKVRSAWQCLCLHHLTLTPDG